MKSKILEYIVRKILFNCGFSSVTSDSLYIFDRNPLQMINGKGAAHDADVLMNPPVQMPFSYPSRIIYECKAYGPQYKVGLNIIRSAYGMRSDINDFEIIEDAFLRARQNNHRAVLAISTRKRHYYQVGIATLFTFSKPALEFAANNKIPLLSIDELFKGTGLAQAINSIPSNLEALIGKDNYEDLIRELSKKDINDIELPTLQKIFKLDEALDDCFQLIDKHIDNIYTGLLESGELIFIRKSPEVSPTDDVLQNTYGDVLRAEIHWTDEERDKWWITFNSSEAQYYFYLPGKIAEMWDSYNDAKSGALHIKTDRFARFFLFNKNQSADKMPFKLVLLEKEWLQSLINRTENDM